MTAIQVGNVRPGGIVPLPALPMNRVVASSILDNLEHWQERAEEARSIAEQMSDPNSRRMMLRIAEDSGWQRTPGAG